MLVYTFLMKRFNLYFCSNHVEIIAHIFHITKRCLYGRYLGLGFKVYAKFETIVDICGNWVVGCHIWSWLDQGDTIGENVVPLARNFGSVEFDLQFESSLIKVKFFSLFHLNFSLKFTSIFQQGQ
jgi:hypothetical protein